MRRTRMWVLRIIAGCAVILLVRGTVHAADAKLDEIKKNRFEPQSFYRSYLVPRMDSRLQGDASAASEYFYQANPWVRDEATVDRIERNAVKASKKAVKRYLVESMRLDALSIPLFQTGKPGAVSASGLDAGDTRARLRFGVSHLAPRADLMIPVTYGRVEVRADARGAVDCSFESTSYTFRVDVGVDPRENTATFTVGRRF